MRVLIIDDNKQVVASLQRGLKPSYAVDVALTGQDGILRAESTQYDAILLDLNLPDISGEDVCASLRFSGITTPILILTGRDVVQDKVELLDMGADDYITKPFSLEEIRARIRVALRHHASKMISNTLTLQDLELDTGARTVRRANKPIELRRKEFDLLEYMMRNQGQTLTRPMILEHIWDMNENLWANVVDVHIKHLRDKIDRPYDSQLIKTVHGVGYKLEDTKGA
jgi:two-component system OmpR family response regulator